VPSSEEGQARPFVRATDFNDTGMWLRSRDQKDSIRKLLLLLPELLDSAYGVWSSPLYVLSRPKKANWMLTTVTSVRQQDTAKTAGR
jgi:hypothetical protein